MATILMLMSIFTGCRNKNDEASRQRLHEAIIEKLTSVTREFTSVEEPGGKNECKHFETIAREFPHEKGWTVSYQILVKKDTGETFFWDNSAKKWQLK